MEGYLGSRFVEELSHEIAEALRADAKALGESLARELPDMIEKGFIT
jgi:hypothetical protein